MLNAIYDENRMVNRDRNNEVTYLKRTVHSSVNFVSKCMKIILEIGEGLTMLTITEKIMLSFP